MRILLAIVVAAALGWSLYWLTGARAVEQAARAWVTDRSAEGWVAHAEAIDTRGFPNRFDTSFEGFELADPDTGLAWQAPLFQILALSYRPRHIIAVWPETQSVATPLQRIAVTSEDMRASAEIGPGRSFPLDRAVLTFDAMGLSSTAGWAAAVGSGQMAVRATPAQASVYDLVFEAREVRLPLDWAGLLSRPGLVGEVAEGVSVELQVAFDRPWDLRAVEERRPQPRRIDLRLARAQWGELDLRVAGTLDVDPAGVPEGAITVKATNWREILALAVAGGVVPEPLAGLMENGLGQIAALSGNPSTIDVPLQLADGRVTLAGFVPLGPAPRIVLR